MTKEYLAYELTDACREAVLRRFPPHYKNVVCTHITYQFDVPESTPLPPQPNSVFVVGWADDDDGVQALVVMVDNSLYRPDDGPYHVTLSLGAGRKAVESNDVVKAGWQPIKQPFPLTVKPVWRAV